jgi:hypothetical protein
MQKEYRTPEIKQLFFKLFNELTKAKKRLEKAPNFYMGFQAMETVYAWLITLHTENYIAMLEHTLRNATVQEGHGRLQKQAQTQVDNQLYQFEFFYSLHLTRIMEIQQATTALRPLVRLELQASKKNAQNIGTYISAEDPNVRKYAEHVAFTKRAISFLEETLGPLKPLMEKYYFFEEDQIKTPSSKMIGQRNELLASDPNFSVCSFVCSN